jgi:hypothetical protein
MEFAKAVSMLAIALSSLGVKPVRIEVFEMGDSFSNAFDEFLHCLAHFFP